MTPEQQIAEILERANKAHGESLISALQYERDVAFLVSRLDAKDARIKDLKDGLRPFAELFNVLEAVGYGDPCPIGGLPEVIGMKPTKGDCREAKRLLEQKETNDG